MKYNILALAFIMFGLGCTSSTSDKEFTETEEVADSVHDSLVEDEPIAAVVNKPPLWVIEYEAGTQKEKLKKPVQPEEASFSAADIIQQLNESYADVHLELKKVSNDTIYINIPESEKFTQQMGSTGAYNYMAVIVYNLTELKGVKYVSLDFQEGDHAMPGVFSRDNFQNLR